MSSEKEKAAAASRLTMHKNKGKTEDEMRRRRNEVTLMINTLHTSAHCTLHTEHRIFHTAH